MRTRIRLKTSEEKKTLTVAMDKYNVVASSLNLPAISSELVDSGTFPWMEKVGIDGKITYNSTIFWNNTNGNGLNLCKYV